VRGASIEQADLFSDGCVPLHLFAAFRTLVQLFPTILDRIVIGHEAASMRLANDAIWE
jgi:hypothetical protein